MKIATYCSLISLSVVGLIYASINVETFQHQSKDSGPFIAHSSVSTFRRLDEKRLAILSFDFFYWKPYCHRIDDGDTYETKNWVFFLGILITFFWDVQKGSCSDLCPSICTPNLNCETDYFEILQEDGCKCFNFIASDDDPCDLAVSSDAPSNSPSVSASSNVAQSDSPSIVQSSSPSAMVSEMPSNMPSVTSSSAPSIDPCGVNALFVNGECVCKEGFVGNPKELCEELFTELKNDTEVRNEALKLALYPNQLHQRMFGFTSNISYPVYEVLNWTGLSQVNYTVQIPEDGSVISLTILEIIFSDEDLNATEIEEIVEEDMDVDFIFDEGLMEISIFFGRMGSPAVELVGAILHVPSQEEDIEPFTALVVFREALSYGYSEFGFGSEFTNNPPPTANENGRRFLESSNIFEDIKSSEKSMKSSERFYTNTEPFYSVCRGFFNLALNDFECFAGEDVRYNEECATESLISVQSPFNENLQIYNDAVEQATKLRDDQLIALARRINQKMTVRGIIGFKTRFCPNGCGGPRTATISFPLFRQDFTVEWAENVLRRELAVEEATEKAHIEQAYKDTVATAKKSKDEADANICPGVVEIVREDCLECFICDAANDTSIECCDDTNCESGVCVANVCVTEGRPRFSLTWFGEDDLDLHVITPLGNEIYYGDTQSDGGFLDHDDIPSSPDTWVENIVFPPGEGSFGTYTVFVNPYNVIGLPDFWELEIFFGSTLVASYTGNAVATSEYFEIEYLENNGDNNSSDCEFEEMQQYGSCTIEETSPELPWYDAIVDFEDLNGGFSGTQRVVYIDLDMIPRTRAYKDDPYWWKYYRSFWSEDGTDFVENGELFEQGRVGDDCFGLEWYEKDTVELRFRDGGDDLYSTRYCIPVSQKNSNNYCSVYLANHYRAKIGRYIPGLFTLGPTYNDPSINLPGVAMNFGIFLDEFVETSDESYRCYASGFWRHVIPGEVTADGWGIIPQIDAPQGTSDTPFFQWLFIVPKGKSLRMGRCLPTALNCRETATNEGDALLLDPPLSQISDEEREKREREKFERLVEEGAALGGLGETRMRDFDKRKEGFYIMTKDPDGTWVWSTTPVKDINEAYNLIKLCNCLTINGSGNRWEAGLDAGRLMAEEKGRDFNLHYYMPVSAGPFSYAISDVNSKLPDIIGEISDRAYLENIRLDIQGHSWSSWLLWKSCGNFDYSGSGCENVDLTTWAPATMPYNWNALREYIDTFKGEGDIIYGSRDPLAIPTLMIPQLGDFDDANVDVNKINGIGHGIQSLTDACQNCRALSPFHIRVSNKKLRNKTN